MRIAAALRPRVSFNPEIEDEILLRGFPLVELIGIEPTTSGLQSPRSPS